MIYRSGGIQQFELEGTIETLQRWPLELIPWPTPNSHRIDYTPNLEAKYDDRVVVASLKVLPADERNLIRWNGCPFKLDGGSGMQEQDPGAWLFPYWCVFESFVFN